MLPIVDPIRLDELREVIDLEVAERHLRDQVDYRWACCGVTEDLGFRLYFCEAPFDLWLGWLVPADRKSTYEEEYLRIEAPDGRVQSLGFHRHPWLRNSCSWMLATSTRCWASCQRDAILGASLLAIDSHAGIFYDSEDCSRYLPRPVVAQIAIIEQILESNLDLAIDHVSGGMGSCDIDFHRVHLLDHIAERAQTLNKTIKHYTSDTRPVIVDEILRHRDALTSQQISMADIPSPLDEHTRAMLTCVFGLAMPVRDILYFINRAIEVIRHCNSFQSMESQ